MNRILLYIILVVVALSMCLPFVVMFLISMSGTETFYSTFNISDFSFKFYKNMLDMIPVTKFFVNSLIVALLTTIGQVIVATFAGYGFARCKFFGSHILFYVFLLTMVVPPQVNIVPLFYIISKLGWIDTYQAMIVPGIFGAFGIFFMKQHFSTFSKELEEASILDGCGSFQTFYKIAIPYAVPAIAILGIFTFVTTWNSFMWPLIVTNTETIRTLTVGLTIFKSSFREVTLWGELMACSFVCSIPVILVFLVGKKYLLNNLLDGALKE